MNRVHSWLVWLSRIHRVWGFGIQSPADYAFVRNVINEHWSYYAYEELRGDDWLTQKLGRLYFRLANWRQPSQMHRDGYERYWQAGCRRLQMVDACPGQAANPQPVELARQDIEDDTEELLAACDEHSVVVVEGLWRNRQRWREIQQDHRVGTTFDLYYCGILFFDKQRYKHQYIINF